MSGIVKVDLKKEMPTYAASHGVVDLISVPPLRYLMIDGHGDPNTSLDYSRALETLYPVAYGLKFLSKNDLDRDYVVPPLEALWWSEDMDAFTRSRDKSRWDWSTMILVPDWLTDKHVDTVRGKVAAKGAASALDLLRVGTVEEGLCVQTLHIGSYDDEGPVLAHLHDVEIPSRSLRMTGRHHEIYLSDPRRVEASRLRTILRQPVARESV